ncbi:hypothetical protein Tco_1251300, partial [Tanacetum coccineum]
MSILDFMTLSLLAVFPERHLLIIAAEFSMANSCDPHTCWCTCEVVLCSQVLVVQKEFIRICSLDLLDYVPELLHKDLWNTCRDSKNLEACGILDYINDNLKCLFLLWHSGFESQIGRAYLDSFRRWNPLFIISSHFSQESSSNVQPANPPFEHLNRWTKDHPLDNVIGNPSRPVSTRCQLQTDVMWCFFDAFLTSVDKNFKDILLESSWIDA